MTSPQANRITTLALPRAASTSDPAPRGASAGSDAGTRDRGAHLPPATRSSLPGSSLRQRPRADTIANVAQGDERARVLRVLETALGQPGKTNVAIAADFRAAARATVDADLSQACDRAGDAFERDVYLRRGVLFKPVDPLDRTRGLHVRFRALDGLQSLMREDAQHGVSALKAEVARLMGLDVLPRLVDAGRPIQPTWDIAARLRNAIGATALRAAMQGGRAEIAAVPGRMEVRSQFVDALSEPAVARRITRLSFFVAAKRQLADTHLLATVCAAHVRAWGARQPAQAVPALAFWNSTAVAINRNSGCDRLLDEVNDACKADDRQAAARLAAKEFFAIVVDAIGQFLPTLHAELDLLEDLVGSERASGATEAATALLDVALLHGRMLHRQLAHFGPMARGFFERATCEGELAPAVLQRALAVYAQRMHSRDDLVTAGERLSPRAIVAQVEDDLRAEAWERGLPERQRSEFDARERSAERARQALMEASDRQHAVAGSPARHSNAKGRRKARAALTARGSPPSTMRAAPLPREPAAPRHQLDEAIPFERERLRLAVEEASGEGMPADSLVDTLLAEGLRSLCKAADAADVAGLSDLVDEAAGAISRARLEHDAVRRFVRRRQFLHLPDKARYDAMKATSLIHAVPFSASQPRREFAAERGRPNETIRETVLRLEESDNPGAPERLRRLPAGQFVMHVHELDGKIIAAHFKRYADRRLGKVNDRTGQNVWRGHILGEHEFVRQVERTAPSPRSTSVQRLDGAGDAADQVARDQR